MSGLYDYYRADGREAALVRPQEPRVVDASARVARRFDAVDAKGIEPTLILGQFLAFVAEVDYSADLVEMVDLYPPPEDAPQGIEGWETLPEGSPYLAGPAIVELSADVRDMLAGADNARLAEVVERWAGIEEFSYHAVVDREYLAAVAKELVELARRAREHGQMLYCWMCS
jgi:hypothetical protein